MLIGLFGKNIDNSCIMRILLLTQWFDPEPTFKGLLFAKALQDKGHDVEVLTGFPNYPGGSVYPGYSIKWIKIEIMKGIKVTRVPLYPSHNKSAIKRIINYLSFSITSILYGIFWLKKPDVIYVYHPPITVGISGAIIGMFRRVPFVCDIQDLWPDTLSVTGMLTNKKILNIVSIACNWVYKRSAHIVVLSPGFKDRLTVRGVDESKVSVIYNWCDEISLTKGISKNDIKSLPRGFNVVFAGNMGPAQALETAIKAGEIIAKEKRNINFVFVGGGLQVDSLKTLAIEKGLSNIYFIPRVPIDKVGGILKQADVLLVHLKKDPLFEITIPSKTQAYLAQGKPLIMAVGGNASDLVISARAGLSIEPESPEKLAEAAIALFRLSQDELEKIGNNGLSFYKKELSLDIGVEKFLEVFKLVEIQRNKNA